MRRLERRIYAGVPRELVTVDTEVVDGGHVTVLLDDNDAGSDPAFALKPNPGDETALSIGLIGAVGESCVVRIREVDGGADLDLLVCQTSDPAPIHSYRFIVTPPGAIAALARAAAADRHPAKRAKKAPSRKRVAAKAQAGRSTPTRRGARSKPSKRRRR